MKKMLFVFALLCAPLFLFSQGNLSTSTGFFTVDYFEGKKEISPDQFKELIKSDPAAASHWKNSSSQATLAYVLDGVAIVSIIGGALTEDTDKSLIWYSVGIGAGVGAIISALSSKASLKKAIKAYNNNLNLGGLEFRGNGIVYRF